MEHLPYSYYLIKSSQQPWEVSLIDHIHLHFTEEETEAPRGWVTPPKLGS